MGSGTHLFNNTPSVIGDDLCFFCLGMSLCVRSWWGLQICSVWKKYLKMLQWSLWPSPRFWKFGGEGDFIILFTPVSSFCFPWVQRRYHFLILLRLPLFHNQSIQKESLAHVHNSHQRKLTHMHWLGEKTSELCMHTRCWIERITSVISAVLLPASHPSCSPCPFFFLATPVHR